MSWTSILGQEFVVGVLHAHLASGHLAGAYLLAGPEGVGKHRIAMELAKALNCTAEPAERPCDACPTCGQISRGTHPDVHVLLPEGAADQIKIDGVRQLIGRVNLRPFSGQWQVAVIAGADQLTEEAGNSLLKSLEEPAQRTRFVLTTSHLSHCLPTIISRCQVLRCRRLAADVIRDLLVRDHGCPPETAARLAPLAQGSVAVGVALHERWAAYEALVTRCAQPAVEWLKQPMPDGRQDVAYLLEGMTGWLRDVAVLSAGGASAGLTHAQHAEALQRQARSVDPDRCVDAALELVALRESIDRFVNPRLVASLARERWLSVMPSGGS